MKKILLIMLLVFLALLFVGCDIEQALTNKSNDKQNTDVTVDDNTEEYKLIVNDDFGIILNELNDCYKEGEEVEVKIFFFSGVRAQVFLDGEELKSTSSEAWKYEAFIFTMPNHDATLQTTINGFPKPQEKCNEHKYENGHCIYCGIKEVKDNTSNYNKFIDLDSSCGLDLFVYNDNGIDKCVLFSHKIIKAESCGTVIYTLLQIIQDSLDNYSLSIDEMKEVLKTYEEDDLHYIIIHIVDEKINYDDLNYYYSYSVDGEKLEKRTEVANKLGLDISSELEHILLQPVFSSGVIYAKVGSTLDISFDLSPVDYAYKNVYIKSSNESVVKIDNTGKASFISEGGAQIIFSVDGILAYYPVSVSNEDVEKITLPDEIKSINQDDLVAMTGFHSMISSYIFRSTNEDLLKYVLDLCLSIKYSEILTDENRDPVAENQDKYVSIQLTNNRLLRLTLTTESNVYLQYLEKVGGDFVVKYQFKACKPEQYNALTAFCQMGMPQNHWWCETPACTKYYTGDYPIDEYKQETIVKTFIDHKSPLSNFYKNGTKFSGFIRKSFGKFNNYYAVIVDGCGLYYTECEEEVTIDGVKFTYSDSNQMYLICAGGVLSLQDAFEEEIISHDDLVEISKRLNGNDNPKTSEELSNDLVNLLNSYYYDNSKYYSEYVYSEVDNIKMEYSIKALLDKIYIEEMFNGLNHIIKEENGYVYLYYYDNDSFLHRRFVSMKDDFSSNEVTEEDQIEEYLFDPFSIDKIEISLEDGTYILKGLISSLNLGIKYQRDFYVDNNDYYELKIEENNGVLSMTMSFKVHIDNKLKDFSLIYSISRKEFPILDTSLINEEIPTHIEEVTKKSDLTESFVPTILSGGKLCGYYLVHLDKGLYYFDIEGKKDLPIYGNYSVYLCDTHYEHVEVGNVINYREFKEGNNQFFEVFESGDYYLSFKANNRDDYSYQLKKATYPIHEKKDLSNLNGSITGLFDFYEVVYQAENFGSINLTNNGESDVYILFIDNIKTTTNESLRYLTIKPGATMSIPLYNDEEKDMFYITSRIILPTNDNRLDANYDFQLSAEIEEYDNTVYDITLENTTTFAVYKSGIVKGRIVISEAGYYTIKCICNDAATSGHIENGNEYIIYNGSIDVWYLEPGTYIVDFKIENSFFNKCEATFQLEKRNIE